MIHSNNDYAFNVASLNGHIEVMKLLLDITLKLTPEKQRSEKMIQKAFEYIHGLRFSEAVIKFLLIHMDENYFQLSKNRYQTIQLSEVFHERGKIKITDLCIKFEIAHAFVDCLTKDSFDNLIQDLKQWSLLIHLLLVVKVGLSGLQRALHPSLPDEIFSIIISFYSDNQVEEVSDHVKNTHQIQNLIKSYIHSPKVSNNGL